MAARWLLRSCACGCARLSLNVIIRRRRRGLHISAHRPRARTESDLLHRRRTHHWNKRMAGWREHETAPMKMCRK